jgi:hypothetical protein
VRPVTTFRTTLSYGGVFAMARAGDTLYIGGRFTKVNDVWQARLAAVSTVTGARDGTFTGSANEKVNALAVAADGRSLLVGGYFRTLSGQPVTTSDPSAQAPVPSPLGGPPPRASTPAIRVSSTASPRTLLASMRPSAARAARCGPTTRAPA